MRNVYSNKYKKLKIGIRFEMSDLEKHEKEYKELYEKIHNFVENCKKLNIDHKNKQEYIEMINREDTLNSIGKYIRGGVVKKNKTIKKYFGESMLIIGLGISSEDPCKYKKCSKNCVLGMPDTAASRRKARHCWLMGKKVDTKFNPSYTT